MKNKYRHLGQKERDRIFLLLRQGKTQKQIAHLIGRDKSTISRELKRNKHKKFEVYLPDTAERKSFKRNQWNRKERYLDKSPVLREYVLFKLKLGWSPEQIEGRIRNDLGQYLNYESIYQYIYGLAGRKENLRQYLRRSHRIRRKKHGRKHQKGKIPNRIDISLRPKIVGKRRQFGHWEGDSLIFKKHSQCLATQTERKTRLVVALRPKNRTAKERTQIINQWFSRFPQEARMTMTFDNGLEFADHQKITSSLGTKIYFAKPYASWQRGTNENSNGLIRWYLPKNTDLDSLTDDEFDVIIKLINNRPRKCLNFRTANEAFRDEMNKIFNKSKVEFNQLTSHSVALAN